MELQKKNAVFQCEKHGEMAVTLFKVYCDWSTPSCPKCQEEEEKQKAEQLEKRRQEAKQAAIEARLKGSCIPPRFQGKDFGSYTPSTAAATKSRNMCLNYAEQFPSFLARGTSIILCGRAGTGKTHLACAIANYIISNHGKVALYQLVSSALRQVKETYGKTSKRTEQEVINFFTYPDLLILDEVGVQFGTDAERNILFEIINSRYEQLKPTILISNLEVKELVDYAGERAIDRMKENGGMVQLFEWDSYRGRGI